MSNKKVDIAVIGGGIVGLGIAAELSSTGKSVSLFEKGKVSTKASGNSLRIIHGGLRYLQNLDFIRTLESSKAQAELLKKYPEHIEPLKCLMPLDRWGLKSRLPASIGLSAYRLMAKAASGRDPGGRILNAKEALTESALLDGICDYGALQWFDAQVLNPGSFAGLLVRNLEQNAVLVNEESPVVSISREGSGFVIEIGGRNPTKLNCDRLIDASGAWLGRTDGLNPSALEFPGSWCKAYNVVLTRQLEPQAAIGLKSSSGRLYFLVPRGDHSVLGTFYSNLDSQPDEVSVSDQEVQFHLDEFNKLCPAAKLSSADVAGVDLGVLPKGRSGGEVVEPLGRERLLKDGNLISVVSTKYTTFENLAKKAARLL